MISAVFGLPRAGKSTVLAWSASEAAKGHALTVGRGAWSVSLGDFAPYQAIFSTFPIHTQAQQEMYKRSDQKLLTRLHMKKACAKIGKWYDSKIAKIPRVYQIDFDNLGKIALPPHSLILIDEISLVCDSRDYKTYAKHTKEFMALHGHYKCDILYASQGYEDTDKRIRNMTDTLLYVDRFGGFSRVRPIKKAWSIDGSITEGYTLAPPLSSMYLRRKPYYCMFDSFSAPALPVVPLVQW